MGYWLGVRFRTAVEDNVSTTALACLARSNSKFIAGERVAVMSVQFGSNNLLFRVSDFIVSGSQAT